MTKEILTFPLFQDPSQLQTDYQSKDIDQSKMVTLKKEKNVGNSLITLEIPSE